MSESAEPPRILLIGVRGQVGWELHRMLPRLGNVFATAHCAEDNVFALDLTQLDSIAAAVRVFRPTLIVNAAAYTAVDQAERESEAAEAVNGVAPGIVQEEANRLGAAVVHFSTDYVFDGSGSQPWKENDPTGPLSVYGRSKLAGEQAVAAAGGAYVILRTSWVYGVHGVNFIKKILKLATERETLRIVDDQVGAPTSARFLAETVFSMLAQARRDFTHLFRERGGIFHVCPSGETTWYRFTQELVARARSAGMQLAIKSIEPIATSDFPTAARRPLNSRLHCGRLRQEYGIVAPSWQDVLSETLPTLLRQEFGVD